MHWTETRRLSRHYPFTSPFIVVGEVVYMYGEKRKSIPRLVELMEYSCVAGVWYS